MPTDAPPVRTEVQGGEGIGVGIIMGGSGGSLKSDTDEKVVGKVITTQLHTSLPKVSSTVTSATTTRRPLTKGIVIGSGVVRSSLSKPPTSTKEMKNKGKGIYIEPTAEEKKVVVEKELEKQRKNKSILR